MLIDNNNKYLVVSTFRTGSTLLCDVIASNKNVPNYREYFIDATIARLQGELKVDGLIAEYGKKITNLNNQPRWVTKLITTPCLYGKQLIDSDCNLILLYRKNIVDQFESEINMVNRRHLLGRPSNTFTKDVPVVTYSEIRLPKHMMREVLMSFVQRLEVWRLLYQGYRERATIIQYEDNILNFNLSKLGIETNTSNQIKTPFSTTNLLNDDWQIYVDFLEHYKQYTEIDD